MEYRLTSRVHLGCLRAHSGQRPIQGHELEWDSRIIIKTTRINQSKIDSKLSTLTDHISYNLHTFPIIPFSDHSLHSTQPDHHRRVRYLHNTLVEVARTRSVADWGHNTPVPLPDFSHLWSAIKRNVYHQKWIHHSSSSSSR